MIVGIFTEVVVVVLVGEGIFQLIPAFLEGVGDVFEEDEAEHHVLVFGRVDVGAQLVGSVPELLVEVVEELLFFRIRHYRSLIVLESDNYRTALPWSCLVLSRYEMASEPDHRAGVIIVINGG